MASKTYTVMKDGDILKELKTLAAAKKLADNEDAEVFCGGLCVYAPDPDLDSDTQDDTDALNTLEALPAEPAAEVPVVETVTPDKYRLTHRMNVRKGPSVNADKAGEKASGTVVDVLGIVDDWLNLTDGTFILYSGGKYAEKI